MTPHGQLGNGVETTKAVGLVMAVSGTDATVQVPEGCTIPTTGGITSVAYSTQANPYGWVSNKDRWGLTSLLRTSASTTSNASYGSFLSGGWSLTVPVGSWQVGWQASVTSSSTTIMYYNISTSALTGLTGAQGNAASDFGALLVSPSASFSSTQVHIAKPKSHSVSVTYVFYTLGASTSHSIAGADALAEIYATPAGL